MKIYSLLLLVASGSAFSPAFVNKQALPLTPLAMAEDDFDAPIDRAVSVGNVVRRPQDRPLKVKGVRVPRFIGRIFNLENKEAVGDFDSLMSMDDECYMGKDGTADDCVDFDPPTKSP